MPLNPLGPGAPAGAENALAYYLVEIARGRTPDQATEALLSAYPGMTAEQAAVVALTAETGAEATADFGLATTPEEAQQALIDAPQVEGIPAGSAQFESDVFLVDPTTGIGRWVHLSYTVSLYEPNPQAAQDAAMQAAIDTVARRYQLPAGIRPARVHERALFRSLI